MAKRNATLPEKVKERDNHICQNCKSDKESLEAHHIVPLANGGSDTMDNMVALCDGCHQSIHSSNETKLQMKSKVNKPESKQIPIREDKRLCRGCLKQCEIDCNKCPKCHCHVFIMGDTFTYGSEFLQVPDGSPVPVKS